MIKTCYYAKNDEEQKLYESVHDVLETMNYPEKVTVMGSKCRTVTLADGFFLGDAESLLDLIQTFIEENFCVSEDGIGYSMPDAEEIMKKIEGILKEYEVDALDPVGDEWVESTPKQRGES